MRLINATTYEFEDHDTRAVDYAILSHTWRDDEVLYHDFLRNRGEGKLGYRKIEYLCSQALKDGLGYVWIDTACIDKTSSAELSEAINSMYKYYQDSSICYVFLDDTIDVQDIARSRWITRGWTLQELIAPATVHFYNLEWILLGDKKHLSHRLSEWTGIEQIALEEDQYWKYVSIASRMSWAASRSTSRIEDQAYCLLGIFKVNMPLIYGEGEAAFIRLQEQILKHSNDQSILLGNREDFGHSHGYLAAEVSCFEKLKIINVRYYQTSIEVTKAGLKIRLLMLKSDRPGTSISWGILNCRYQGNNKGLVAIPLRLQRSRAHDVWEVQRTSESRLIDTNEMESATENEIILAPNATDNGYMTDSDPSNVCNSVCTVHLKHSWDFEVYCELSKDRHGTWNDDTLTSDILTMDYHTLRTFFFVHVRYNVVFMIRFVDVWLPGDRELWEGGALAYLATATKPRETDTSTWISTQKANAPASVNRASQASMALDLPPYHRWAPGEQEQFECDIDFPAFLPILRVKVTVGPYQAEFDQTVCWRIQVNIEYDPATS